ncbi:acyltransferase [Roseococcus sp. SDR]|uniref:acyltransferase family protein n=1 Tax=Roseococcus sp. SDR TaxID=2835532 RepID=UPI001BCD20B3|nr:acyltransferase [Roseococcus sp. SDR]MBS7789684.1 acyltransferase [Roseococcus sp. SDR]MBV1844998.1 acyltransferase [Roseococcus sp. SDR]
MQIAGKPQSLPAPATAQGRVVFLDLLRIFAFASVLAGHKFYPAIEAAAQDPGLHVTVRLMAQILAPFVWAGGAGVIVFFLVSGYIITQVLQREGAGEFVLRRIFRIYPLYIAAVLIETLLATALLGQPVPPLSVMIPRLLLIGDLFGTPYALAGVEWTLRLEVLFYAIMAVLKAAGLIERPRLLPWIYLGLSALGLWAGPMPTAYGWSDGFITLYLPFLFVGSIAFLHERRLIGGGAALACAGIIYAGYLLAVPGISPRGANSHFLTLACLLSLALWLVRARLTGAAWIVFLSNLTYAVYLFHNWLWSYLDGAVRGLGLGEGGWAALATLLLLLLLCALAHRVIEQPGIALGRRLVARLQARGGA